MTNNKPSELTTSTISEVAPKELGYYFPAEFALHRATWLSWPHKEASWPGKIHTIYPQNLVYPIIIKKVFLNFLLSKMWVPVWI